MLPCRRTFFATGESQTKIALPRKLPKEIYLRIQTNLTRVPTQEVGMATDRQKQCRAGQFQMITRGRSTVIDASHDALLEEVTHFRHICKRKKNNFLVLVILPLQIQVFKFFQLRSHAGLRPVHSTMQELVTRCVMLRKQLRIDARIKLGSIFVLTRDAMHSAVHKLSNTSRYTASHRIARSCIIL